jgi:flagellar biosynthesis protein FlhB
MADTGGQEKTEQATPKKLTDERDKGQVAKSIEINSLAIFLGGLLLIFLTQSFLSEKISTLSIYIFSSLDTLEVDRTLIHSYFQSSIFFYFTVLGPLFVGLMVIAFTASASQVGLKFSKKALAPKASKFNPLKGIKRIFFSSRSLVEVFKSVAKLIIIGGFTYIVLNDLIKESTSLQDLAVSEILSFMVDAAYSLLWKIAIVYTLIASTDFVFQKYKFKKDVMMTKQEIKEEGKQTDGDPQIKSRIRKLQFQAASKRMMADVVTADVIITNPTHYAIALRYNLEKDHAPKVVAKGVDLLAQRIKKLAEDNNIPLHEDKQLARTLYKACDVGDKIPANLFQAVAQILAYIYQLKTQKTRTSII